MSAEPQPLAAATGPIPQRRPLRVLVVDDDRDAADSTAELFVACGAEALACYSGEDALTRIVSFDPDACILDVNMPGVDGIELAENILVMAGGKPLLVALTGRDDAGVRQRIADGVFDLHFVKPADPTQLLRALGEQVALRAG